MEQSEEEDVEEMILMVELSGLPNPDMITQCQRNCSILGIDSPTPMLQLDNYVFKGRYVDTLGTAMIFKQDKGKRLSYVCKTDRKLEMSRVVLRKMSSHEQQHLKPSRTQPPVTKTPQDSNTQAHTSHSK